ncbi:hypothetical protein KIN20_022565 [Parelaphostrongylus tenuis]|uniref:Uncharacterized protein n=1 Tax=Parelaphostrongylus tenuis TaxID=148309 RepID=A0AAD5QWU5_PARTN|nr:hypothetical protein KIN20_022565 [Parelaphostrongylus tenuis]
MHLAGTLHLLDSPSRADMTTVPNAPAVAITDRYPVVSTSVHSLTDAASGPPASDHVVLFFSKLRLL